MKKASIVSAAIVALLATPAMAADLPAPMPTKAPLMPVMVIPSWTSCYVGGNVGAAWERTNVTDEVAGYEIASLSDTAVAGGGQVGCDYQLPGTSWVFGARGMYDGTGLAASTTSPVLAPDTLNGKIPWFATVTGRLGYAVAPNWLIYGQGGGAWTHTNATLTGPGPDSASFDQSGWTAGGGIEWRINPYVSIFAEYDYLGFGDKLVVSVSGANLGIVHQDVQVGLVGLNIRFGGH
jgi:outer membrane immunogenic protein